jgi:hypothetical protein
VISDSTDGERDGTPFRASMEVAKAPAVLPVSDHFELAQDTFDSAMFHE